MKTLSQHREHSSKWVKTLIVCALTSFAVVHAFADDTKSDGIKFDGQSGSSQKGGIKFSVPSDEEYKAKQAAEAAAVEENAAAYPGYPKGVFTLEYFPTIFGARFTYSGVNFNYSNIAPLAVELKYRFQPTPNFLFDVSADTYTASTQSGNTGVLSVESGSVGVFDLNVKSNYCFIGSNFFSKICPGLDLGYNSFPALAFSGNTSLSLQKVSDFMIGPSLYVQKPVIGSTLFETRLGYLFGTGAGGTSQLEAKTDNLVYISGTFTWSSVDKRFWNVGAIYSNRAAKLSGTKGSNTDKWDIAMDELSLMIGYSWEL